MAGELAALAALLALANVQMHSDRAADAWSEADPAAQQAALDYAESAMQRAQSSLRHLLSELPGHSRRARLIQRAVERGERLLEAVRSLPPTPINLAAIEDEDAADDEELALTLVSRASGALGRAVDSARAELPPRAAATLAP